jgi:alginate O-acetyltransferase complex protein AlgI
MDEARMVFSSLIFLFFFLPVVLSVYLLLRPAYRNAWLLMASLLFYAWGEQGYVFLLLFSCLSNHVLAAGLRRFDRSEPGPRQGRAKEGRAGHAGVRRSIFVLGISLNLALLCFYKYFNFILENVNTVLVLTSVTPLHLEKVQPPVGISFFTFHSISCLCDIYFRKVENRQSLWDFALYLSFFPKILAGPIFKFRDAAGQLAPRNVNYEQIVQGIERFVVGLGKKVLIASPIALAADTVFSLPPGEVPAVLAWFGIVCYSFQIYLDFSGYTDMAIGLGMMFGFEIPENFNYPYSSQSIREFWRRWHITLSLWFRDYLYIPMGGNRHGPYREYFHLLVVFLLCGLWHGASWTFVVWGGWHGMFLIAERTALGRMIEASWRPVRHVYAMGVVIVGWVLFRSDGIAEAVAYVMAMCGFSEPISGKYTLSMVLNRELMLALAAASIVSFPVFSNLRARIGEWPRTAATTAGRGMMSGWQCSYVVFLGIVFVLSSMALMGGTYNPFIYFKF